MNVDEKSDIAIVPKKISNKGGLPPAEGLEGRAVLKWNSPASQPQSGLRAGELRRSDCWVCAMRRKKGRI